MKSFVYKVVLFIVIIIATDTVFGIMMRYISAHAKGGDSAREYYIFNKMHDDILIMGSSRGMYNYDADMIRDSMHLSCYACGFEGMGIITNYALYCRIMKRHHPRYIIYDVYYKTDLMQHKDNSTYLSLLKPYHSDNTVKEMMNRIDSKQKFKTLSDFYNYNSVFLQMIQDCIHPTLSAGNNGYRPIDRTSFHRLKEEETYTHYDYDTLKIYYLERLIKESKGKTKLIFVISPFFRITKGIDYQALQALCDKYDVPLLNYSSYGWFGHDSSLFADNIHLNRKGAEVFSKVIIKELKQYKK